ncbi:MAG: SMP-30/gluconolactonase/LRE family protein [Proteobacteria bacterium]|nr:SMP-30/gluconolactonase/LRE family protein [Pseudomonadota bacterium]
MSGVPNWRGFRVSLDDLVFVGSGLNRPECVLCNAAGNIYTADWRGGVACTRSDGTSELFAGRHPRADLVLRPNGIALRRSGAFLVAQLGADDGGVYELSREGGVRPFLEAIDGRPLEPTNFVYEDALGRVWLTISSRHRPRHLAFRADIADGFIALVDGGGARIVADDIGYTNEVGIDPTGEWLYVNETFGRRLSRFPVRGNGDLGAKEVVAQFGSGTFPDGLTFDVEGGVWITSVVSNRVIRVAPDGTQTLLIEDADPGHLAEVEAAYVAGKMDRPHLEKMTGRRLKNISSLAFGGPDRRTAYLGCLLGDSIASFRAPIAGAAPPHWRYP